MLLLHEIEAEIDKNGTNYRTFEVGIEFMEAPLLVCSFHRKGIFIIWQRFAKNQTINDSYSPCTLTT